MKASDPFCVLGTLTFFISMILFFALLLPDLNTKDPYYHTSCSIVNVTLELQNVCHQHNCSCVHSSTLPNCYNINYNSTCQNTGSCCSSRCNSCIGFQKYPCGDAVCELPYTYQCNCSCLSTIKECFLTCETNTNITFTYQYDNTTVNSIEQCNNSNQCCVKNLLSSRQLNSTLDCWIRDDIVYFSSGYQKYNPTYLKMYLIQLGIACFCFFVGGIIGCFESSGIDDTKTNTS